MAATTAGEAQDLRDPIWMRALFNSPRWSWFWLIARVYVGWLWLQSGWEKLQSPAWVSNGTALEGAWKRIAAPPESAHPAVAYDWYRNFIEFMLTQGWQPWFAKLVVGGEVVVGLALILGAFTGIAALIGAFMNWNYAMGGMGPAVNAVMLVIAIGIVLAWKTAGWWGLDRWLLPALGTPWETGRVFSGRAVSVQGLQEGINLSEQWFRMAIGVALAIWALATLHGVAQIVVLLAAAALVAITGIGWLPIIQERGNASG